MHTLFPRLMFSNFILLPGARYERCEQGWILRRLGYKKLLAPRCGYVIFASRQAAREGLHHRPSTISAVSSYWGLLELIPILLTF
jgi:hypothetical protein